MANDLFSNRQTYGGSFKAAEASLTFSTGADNLGGLGLLIQNLQAMYQQQVTRVWEIGSEGRQYFIVGRAAGSCSIARIVGPYALSNVFIQRYSDACNIDKNKIKVTTRNAACTAGLQSGYGFENCIITQAGIQIGAQDMVINEQLGLMFNSMTN